MENKVEMMTSKYSLSVTLNRESAALCYADSTYQSQMLHNQVVLSSHQEEDMDSMSRKLVRCIYNQLALSLMLLNHMSESCILAYLFQMFTLM